MPEDCVGPFAGSFGLAAEEQVDLARLLGVLCPYEEGMRPGDGRPSQAGQVGE